MYAHQFSPQAQFLSFISSANAQRLKLKHTQASICPGHVCKQENRCTHNVCPLQCLLLPDWSMGWLNALWGASIHHRFCWGLWFLLEKTDNVVIAILLQNVLLMLITIFFTGTQCPSIYDRIIGCTRILCWVASHIEWTFPHGGFATNMQHMPNDSVKNKQTQTKLDVAKMLCAVMCVELLFHLK